MTRFAPSYRRIARSLSLAELRRHSMEAAFPLEDGRWLEERNAGRRFLDYYGDEGIALALERYGLLDALRRRGFDDFTFALTADDDRHTLAISALHIEGSGPHRIVELALRRDWLVSPRMSDAGIPEAEVLTVDWLCLQNPTDRFSLRKLRFPGQRWPGLGVGERVMELLVRVAKRLSLGAVLTVAEHLHNALLYAREMPYLDPAEGGKALALADLLLGHHALTLVQASWALHWECVRGPSGEALRWHGEAQVRPISPELRALFDDAYEATLREERRAHSFVLDVERFEHLWATRLPSLLQPELPGDVVVVGDTQDGP